MRETRVGWLGIVADDVTGACDVAAAVRRAGWSVVVHLGLPSEGEAGVEADCVVVALRVRQAPAERAVAESVAAARWLVEAGAQVVYQKYCSTFDSTPAGNIGPIAAGLAGEAVNVAGRRPAYVGTPATPAVARTVYHGYLFVGDKLLEHSSMRDHPLTPMRDSLLPRLLAAQLPPAATVGRLDHDLLDAPAEGWERAARAADYVVVDALTDADLDVQARHGLDRLGGWPQAVYAGGAGLAGALARQRWREAGGEQARPLPDAAPGRSLVLAGSCSQRTREQVARFPGVALRIDPDAVMVDRDRVLAQVTGAMSEAYARTPGEAVLVYSTAAPEEVTAAQARYGVEPLAAALEDVLAGVARTAVDRLGVTRLICAGGETSGAVTAALGATVLQVGAEAAPGVPWTITDSGLALLLKSGNFGDPDLFTTALTPVEPAERTPVEPAER